MDLEQLTNHQLVLKFDNMNLPGYAYEDELIDAYIELRHLPGHQEDDNGSRQTIINFLLEEEPSQNPGKTRRVVGGRKKTIKR